ncbi:MAG: hypothetical protein C0491_03610 [Novosphingobium sp.]|nr:hypothetical protein [Novosphingobium sp.]
MGGLVLFLVLAVLVLVVMLVFLVFLVIVMRGRGRVRIGVGDALRRPAENGDSSNGDSEQFAHQWLLSGEAPGWRAVKMVAQPIKWL